MLNKDTAASIKEIVSKVELEEFEDVKILARQLALDIDANHTKDNMLWIMCLRLAAQILVDAQKNKTSVQDYISKARFLI